MTTHTALRVSRCLSILALSVSLLAVAALAPRAARADEGAASLGAPASDERHDGGEHPHREVRVDVELPSGGIALWANDGSAMAFAGAGLTIAHRSGHGVALRGRAATELFGNTVGTIDAGYLYRVHLVGDDWLGLGLTLGAGASAGFAEDHSGFWTSYDGPLADGPYAGAYADAAIELRATGFLVAIGGSYHALAPLGAQGDVLHTLEAHLSLGFGFVL